MTIVIERVFDAPRNLVWLAWTSPDQITKWWGPEGFTTRVEKMDFRVGGRSSYVMIGPDGTEYPVSGAFIEIVPEEKIVSTDEFDEGFVAPGIDKLPTGIVMTVEFEAIGSATTEEKTKLTLRVAHPSIESRKSHEEMGVVAGWQSSLDCLDDFLTGTNDGVNKSVSEDNATGLQINADGPSDIVIVRLFDATQEIVFKAFTVPKLVEQWMSGPAEWSLSVEQSELKPGGSFRYIWRKDGTPEMGLSGTYVKLSPPDQIVHRELFDGDWTGGETLITTNFSQEEGRTRMTMTIRYSSAEVRDNVLKSGMDEGMEAGYILLDGLLTHSIV